MLLVVLRLLAVYFATCAVAFFLVNRFVSRVRPLVALFLALAPFLLTGKAMVTAGIYAPLDIAYQGAPLAARAEEMGIRGTRSPILSDIVFQEIPWRKAVRDAAKNLRLPLWNRFHLAGEPLLAVQVPAVLHPPTWIGFLLPLAQAWTFEMTLRHFVALLAMYLFLRDLRLGELPALLGAAGWCFSEYLVFFAGWPLSAAAAPLPLLLLGLRRLAAEPGRRSVALTVAALVLIVTAGHPESVLHVVAGAGVYFLFEIARAGRGRRRRPLLLSLLAGAIALGLTAVLLLPLVEALPQTAEHFLRSAWFADADRSVSVAEALRRSIPTVVPYAFGVTGQGRTAIGFAEPAAYVGAILLPFAFLGVASRRWEKWPLLLLVVLGLAMWARFPGVTDAVTALPLFDIALNERLVFLAAFGIAALAGLGAQQLDDRREVRWFAAAALTVVSILLLYAVVRPVLLRLDMPPLVLRVRLLAQLVPLVALAVAAAFALPRRLTQPLLVLALLLLLLQRRLEAGSLYPTFPNRAFYPDLSVLEPIPRDEPWRFVATGFQFIPNVSALYEVEDVRGYGAMTFRPFTETYRHWSVSQPVWFNRVDDPKRPFLSFLNVRWILTPGDWVSPPGWKLVSQGESTKLFENARALPRVFVPRAIRYEAGPEPAVDVLGEIEDFAAQGVVGEAGPKDFRFDPWLANGRATVEITRYLPESISLAIDASDEAVVGTSIPRWLGWKLWIDGRRHPLLDYNHAFLAFRVRPGRHVARLRYRPDGFVAGAAISGMTLVTLLGHAALAARRRTR